VFARSDGSRYHVVAAASNYSGDLAPFGVATLSAEGNDPKPPALARTQPDPTASDGRPFLEMVTPSLTALPHDVMAAAFSSKLGKLVLASSRPSNALHLADPDTGQGESIPLAGTPRLLAVRDDGAIAAIVHDGGLQFIDLVTRSVRWTSAAHPQFVSFGAPPRVLFDGGSGLVWFDLDKGTTERTPFAGAAAFVVTPGSDSLYQAGEKLSRYDWGPMVGLPRASYDLDLFRSGSLFDGCGKRVWLTGGAHYLVLDCARVFELEADAGSDLRYRGSLDWMPGAIDTLYSARLDRFVSLVGSYRTARGYETGLSELALHEPQRLGLERRVSWRNSMERPSIRGGYLFESPTGRLLVIGTADDGSGTAYLIGVDL
jgi:hypothetical protein